MLKTIKLGLLFVFILVETIAFAAKFEDGVYCSYYVAPASEVVDLNAKQAIAAKPPVQAPVIERKVENPQEVDARKLLESINEKYNRM